MEEKLRKHVDALFEDAPKTQKAFELREEIYTNLLEKYNDLVGKGAKPEEAYEIVVSSIGDVNELIGGLRDVRSPEFAEEVRRNKKKHAKFSAISVVLYILSPVFVIGLSVAGYPIPGVVCLLCCIAAATGIVVYGNAVYGKYEKLDDTMVEDFKSWHAEAQKKEEKKEAYAAIVWPIIVALYFIVSFATGAWFVTWVLFIIGAAVQQIIKINVDK